MKIDADFLGLQIDYSRWASERSIQAARALNDEELSRDLGNSQGGILATLVHIYQADRIWLSRLKGSPRLTLGDPDESWTIHKLADAWARTAEEFHQWLSVAGNLEANLRYRNLAGVEHELPIWQVVLHVVNHASYHRGQITTMLRQLGYTPIATDLHVFYFSRRADSQS
jgi:uncharacterized damage-inducible protein DinB